MKKRKYCVVIHEEEFLDYHVFLVSLSENKKHTVVSGIYQVSEDIALKFLIKIIKDYQLSDDVQVIDEIFTHGKHSKTLYKTIGDFKKVYSVS